jgi:hypothetical protein
LIPLALFFLLISVLGLQGLLCIQMNYTIIFSISVKNVIGIFVGIALKLEVVFGNIDIFIISILLIHEHGRSFHLLVFSSISFFSVSSQWVFLSRILGFSYCFMKAAIRKSIVVWQLRWGQAPSSSGGHTGVPSPSSHSSWLLSFLLSYSALLEANLSYTFDRHFPTHSHLWTTFRFCLIHKWYILLFVQHFSFNKLTFKNMNAQFSLILVNDIHGVTEMSLDLSQWLSGVSSLYERKSTVACWKQEWNGQGPKEKPELSAFSKIRQWHR